MKHTGPEWNARRIMYNGSHAEQAMRYHAQLSDPLPCWPIIVADTRWCSTEATCRESVGDLNLAPLIHLQ